MQNINILWIIGSSQGLLLTLFLILKKDRLINLPLILFVFIMSVELVFQYIYATGFINYHPHLLYFTEPFNMLYGVLIFFYARNIFSNKFIFNKSDLLFFIPFLIYLFYYFPFYFLTAEDKICEITEFRATGISCPVNLLEWIAEVLVTIPFLIISVRLLNKYHHKIKDEYSDISKISYIIVRNLIIISIISYFAEIATIILAYSGSDIAEFLNSFLYILSILIVYIVGYDALVRKRTETELVNTLNEQKLPNFIEETTEPETVRKYEKNTLTEAKIKEITEKITNCIETKKPYRNAELRLNDFAVMIEEHPNNVSQVINDVFNKNFYDFINSFRIVEAKILLKSPDYKNFTITSIGFEVGFNSKSTFYSAFKKFTNTTPVHYQKS